MGQLSNDLIQIKKLSRMLCLFVVLLCISNKHPQSLLLLLLATIRNNIYIIYSKIRKTLKLSYTVKTRSVSDLGPITL